MKIFDSVNQPAAMSLYNHFGSPTSFVLPTISESVIKNTSSFRRVEI